MIGIRIRGKVIVAKVKAIGGSLKVGYPASAANAAARAAPAKIPIQGERCRFKYSTVDVNAPIPK
jgi:hypothetical protein